MKNLKKIIMLVLLTLATQVYAHTKLSHSSPKQGSVISSSPETLSLTFSSKVKLMKVDLRTKQGDKVKLAFILSPISSENFSIPLSVLTQGEYIVHWVAMGKDSHKMKGSFSFKIQSEEVGPTKNAH